MRENDDIKKREGVRIYVCMYRSTIKMGVCVYTVIIEGEETFKKEGVLSQKDTNPDPPFRFFTLFCHFFLWLLVELSVSESPKRHRLSS